VLTAVDHVFFRIKTHERMAIRNTFQRDVSMGRQDVDLDNSLNWLLDRYVENIFSTLDDRLSSLFVAHDRDGDGNLDFEEYFAMIKKLRNESKDAISLRQLVRLYGAMMLSPMVDAPIFVRIARENNLCSFIPGPPVEDAKLDHVQIKRLGAMWSVLEPYVSAYGRVHLEDADGLRVHQDSFTIKQLLKEKTQHETLLHYLKFVQRKLGLEALSLEVEAEAEAAKKKAGKGKKGKPAAAVLSPEEMFGKPDDGDGGNRIKVVPSLIDGLDVSSLTASVGPPPVDSFPDDFDHADPAQDNAEERGGADSPRPWGSRSGSRGSVGLG